MKPLPTSPVQKNRALLWFLNYYRITMISLAHKLGVGVHVIHAVVWGYAVEPAFAQKVAEACSQMVGMEYTVEDLGIFVQMSAVTMSGQQEART